MYLILQHFDTRTSFTSFLIPKVTFLIGHIIQEAKKIMESIFQSDVHSDNLPH